MVDYNSIIEGTVKFRDGKKWKSRWCVMRKLSPVADCLHLQLYRDSKDRYKQGQTKASLSLQHFLGVESGFTLDKESNTIAIVCQDVTVILAFDTRERLIQWQVKISNNLGEDQQFLIQITSAPSKAKMATGPARLHVQDHRFSITSGVPPRLMGSWEIAYLRRYGVVEGRFCFEGGSRCGKGEGLHVCVSDQGEEITQTIKLASQGKLATRRRPVMRKMSAMDSPRKQLHSRADTRISDLSCTEAFMSSQPNAYMDGNRSVCGEAMNRSMCSDDGGTFCGCSADMHDGASRNQSSEDLLCPCRMHRGRTSPFWPTTDSATGHHGNSELDSNYGCGDTVSVSELNEHYQQHDAHWSHDSMPYERRGMTALERCASCISKLGAPSMSRSSTATHTTTPNTPFSPAWTMEPMAPTPTPSCHHARSNAGSSCDRVSLSSHGSAGSSGNSEYSVPRFVGANESCRFDCQRASTGTPPPPLTHQHPPVVPPKSPKTQTPQQLQPLPLHNTAACQCCPPSRPPKPGQLATGAADSPVKKKPKKLPMPLPAPPPSAVACTCNQPHRNESSLLVGPYENYDVPKTLLGHSIKREEPSLLDPNSRLSMAASTDEYYDTPKSIKENLAADPQYGNYDTPPSAKMLRKTCGCVVKLTKKGGVTVAEEQDPQPGSDCPCQRVMCWAENWMMLPYCRRGNGMENTGVPIHNKVKLSGEGKMPVMNSSGEIAIYATVDKSKKANRRSQQPPCLCPNTATEETQLDTSGATSDMNYVNVEPDTGIDRRQNEPHIHSTDTQDMNYQNIDFAHSLENYENSKDFLQRVGMSQQDIDNMAGEFTVESMDSVTVSYSVNNGVKFCNKCGHTCHLSETQPSDCDPGNSGEATGPALTPSADATTNKQDDYLMMEPGNGVKTHTASCSDVNKASGKNYPGYIPMSPITKITACNKAELLKKVDLNRSHLAEKSASIPSLAGPYVDRSRKRSDYEFHRVPGSAMMMNHSVNSPYLRRLLIDSEERKLNLLSRKRSSSADSSRFLDDLDEVVGVSERTTSLIPKLSSPGARRESIAAMSNEYSSPNRQSNTSLNCSRETITQDINVENVDSLEIENENSELVNEVEEVTAPCEPGDDGSISSDSLRTLVRECLVEQPQSTPNVAVHIRRSSSVPCKSGNNRDSSSSNDSGVSTGSLKHRGSDFAEFELPLTTSMSARRHYHAVSKHPSVLANCLHGSLPRRSKSVDPLRELTFQFNKIKIPAKSSSAEAEVPVCPTKRETAKGFASPGTDGAPVAPYMDSRSTSSGTSDMSDYIETLSLSSHSSSDTPDSLRLMRPAATTLRPRSGKEYQLIDRSILDNDQLKGGDKAPHPFRGIVSSQYANIAPVPEKSESPSPGYMSSSPGQDREDQPLLTSQHFHKQ